MSKKVLLITEDQIKSKTIIEKNVDAKQLKLVTDNVQEVKLKPILGATLYNDIISAVYEFSVNGTPMTGLYNQLLTDYVQPYLVYAVVIDFMVMNQYKITNKGVLKLKDDIGDNISAEELEHMKNYYENYAVVYKTQLVEFLYANNLLTAKNDTDTTTGSIGWYLN